MDENKELQRLRDHLHVAEQERDALKERNSALGVQCSNQFAELANLRSALTQQIAEWRERAATARKVWHDPPDAAIEKCAADLEKLVEGRSQDGQP